MIKLSSQTVLMLFDFLSSTLRRARRGRQMGRTRAHNKDKWLEHEISFMPWYINIHREIVNIGML